MAGARTYRSLCRNSPPPGKDEFARNALEAAPINNNDMFSYISALLQALTHALTPSPPFAMFMARYTGEHLQKAPQFALNSFL